MTRRSPQTRRRRRDTPTKLALAGLLTVFAVLGVALLTLKAPDGAPGVPRETATVVLPDVGSLRAHNDVRIAGVLVGQVKKVEASGDGAKVTLQLYPSAGAIPDDSTAAVRSAGLLGQRYLQIIRGRSSQDLPEGGHLEAAATSITLGVPDALETFDAQTRTGLGQSVRGLGAGVLGEGQNINEALGAGPRAATDFRNTVDAVLADRGEARALLPRLSSGSGALADASEPLGDVIAPAEAALRPFAQEREAVRELLATAPPTLASARSGFTAAERLLRTVHGLADAGAKTLPRAPAALRSTTALLRESREPLRGAAPLARDVRRTVPRLLRVTRALSPVLEPLEEPLGKLRRPLDILGEHGCDIVNFARVWRSFLGFGSVPGGKIGNLGEIRAEAIVNLPFASAGDSLKLPGALSERDPYPAPCQYAGSVAPTLPHGR